MGQEWDFHRQYNVTQILLNHRDEVVNNKICLLSYIHANGQFVIPDTRILNNPTCILAIVCDMLSWLSAFNNTCNWGELGAQRTSGSGQALTSDRTAEQLTLLLGEQCPLAFAPRVHCAHTIHSHLEDTGRGRQGLLPDFGLDQLPGPGAGPGALVNVMSTRG